MTDPETRRLLRQIQRRRERGDNLLSDRQREAAQGAGIVAAGIIAGIISGCRRAGSKWHTKP